MNNPLVKHDRCDEKVSVIMTLKVDLFAKLGHEGERERER